MPTLRKQESYTLSWFANKDIAPRQTAKTVLFTTQIKSFVVLGPKTTKSAHLQLPSHKCKQTQECVSIISEKLLFVVVLSCKFPICMKKTKQKKYHYPTPIRIAVEKCPRAHTYSVTECIMSGNNLSNCELFICKIATVKHHIISALFQHSPANAEVTASEQVSEESRTEGCKVHIIWCFEKSPCLSQNTSERGWIMTLRTSSLKLNGSATNIWLVRWLQALKGHCYMRT